MLAAINGLILFLAQATSQTASAPDKAPAPAPTGGSSSDILRFLAPLLIIMIIFMLWSGRGRKKEQKAREAMLDSLARGDRVVTIGGICGTVVETKDDEVVVKVDEGANAKIRLKKWSVRTVEPRGGSGEGSDKK